METNKNIKIEQNRYKETRRRITKFRNVFDMSDREIIEYLAEEIEQYRDRIKEQNRIIDELSKITIQSEEVTLDTIEDEMMDKDITEIISTTQYTDGKPIQSKIEYKYKEI
jgi:hypothetical protein